MALFKILKGNKSGLDSLGVTNGYCYVTLDEQKMYIDHVNDSGAGQRFCLNADHADTAATASRLDCGTVGNNITPVYFQNGVPFPCEQIKTETLTINVNGTTAGSFDGSEEVTISIDTISEEDVNTLLEDYLPLSAGEDKKLTGPLGLTENVMYGTTLPTTGFDGQLFFLQEDAEGAPLYVPEGGTTGDVLIKNSDTDGDYDWKELVALPKGGTAGQIMVKSSSTDGDAAWVDGYASTTQSGLVSTGTQSFAGTKIFKQTVFLEHSTNKGTAPSTTQYRELIFRDPDTTATESNRNYGIVGNSVSADNLVTTFLHVYKPESGTATNSTLYLQCDADGTFKAGVTGTSFYGAVWNDYAEYRAQKEIIEPGYCVASVDDGQVYKTTEKFQACDGIVSDTFGFAIGETNECRTPLAVAGRVLAYCEGDRYDYHSGDTVCAGPNGKVCKMTREEIREWPDRIIGIVSEIPEYDTWGTGNVPVNERIWIKVK